MLKRSKKIINGQKSLIFDVLEWLEIDDQFRLDNQQLLFKKVFLEEKEYTIKELCYETNYSERSIFRKISDFERLAKIIEKKNKTKKDCK